MSSRSTVARFVFGVCWPCWLLLGLLPSEARADGGPELALQLKADQLALHPEAGCALGQPCAARVELTGGVRVRSATLELRAGRVTVGIDARGRPYRLRAVGAVVVRAGEREGRADEVVIALRPRRVTLRGQARLDSPAQGLSLRGAWIELDLERGGVIVQGAEVTLP